MTESLELTVLVVSDFEVSEEKTWQDEIDILRALAQQDVEVPFKVMVVESESNRHQAPPDVLFELIPDLELLYAPSTLSAEMKDYGVQRCTTPWVAVFEADAVPAPDWLRRLYARAKSQPDHVIFSGRTWYGDETSWHRALGLLDRSYDDAGVSGDTVHISNNGALYRTDVLKAFPYPDAPTPFLSSRRRNGKILAAGHICYSDRDALTRHAIGGFKFLWDVRRHTGYSDMMMHERQGFMAIPLLTGWRLAHDIRNARRVGGKYLRLWDWPLWLFLYFVARVPEIRGMIEAVSEEEDLKVAFKGSAYR